MPDIEGGKVLPSAEKEARERREREARARGEVIGETVERDDFAGPITAAELEKITEAAYQEGYDGGFQQGHMEGFKAGSNDGEQQAYAETKQRLTDNLNSLSQLIEGLIDPFESHTERLQEFLLNTVVALAGSVVRRELLLSPVDVSNLIDLAINALPKNNANIAIQLHPDDIAMLRESHPHKAAQWQLQENSDLSRGGVVVRSKHSVVDFSIERQLAMLEEKLLRGELSPAGGGSGDNGDSDSEAD
jgi:flagellar assembly protein FliH